jgi:hypothetical protein
MPPEDRQKLESDQKKIGRTLEQNRATLDNARHKSGKYSRTLTSSGAEIRTASSELRRAGYLRK